MKSRRWDSSSRQNHDAPRGVGEALQECLECCAGIDEKVDVAVGQVPANLPRVAVADIHRVPESGVETDGVACPGHDEGHDDLAAGVEYALKVGFAVQDQPVNVAFAQSVKLFAPRLKRNIFGIADEIHALYRACAFVAYDLLALRAEVMGALLEEGALFGKPVVGQGDFAPRFRRLEQDRAVLVFHAQFAAFDSCFQAFARVFIRLCKDTVAIEQAWLVLFRKPHAHDVLRKRRDRQRLFTHLTHKLFHSTNPSALIKLQYTIFRA